MDIRIDKLTLENFKCHRFLELKMRGEDVTIAGGNGCGKTSIFDGFLWLLFGRDSGGNGEKTLEIKPLDETGAVRDHEAVTAVEGRLTVDGVPLTLRRELRENWSRRRWMAEPVFLGNESRFYVNGLPCRKGAFDRKVQELVPERLGRVLTEVGYFAGEMHWQDRRAMLLDLAGVEGEDPFREQRGELSLLAYREKLLSQRRGYAESRGELSIRMDACQKLAEDLDRKFDSMIKALDQGLPGQNMGKDLLEQERRRGNYWGHVFRQMVQEDLGERSRELTAEREKRCRGLGWIEDQLCAMERYDQQRSLEAQEAIDGLFPRVRVRLPGQRCDVMVGGVPYAGLSTAGRVNAGMEIIGVLGRHFGVTMPVFVDGAESVSALEGYDGQVIRLVVKEGVEKVEVLARNDRFFSGCHPN